VYLVYLFSQYSLHDVNDWIKSCFLAICPFDVVCVFSLQGKIVALIADVYQYSVLIFLHNVCDLACQK